MRPNIRDLNLRQRRQYYSTGTVSADNLTFSPTLI